MSAPQQGIPTLSSLTLTETQQFQENCTTNCLFLPIIPYEYVWNIYFHAIVYFIGMIYFFMGVAIVSDIFMSAIEVIVSDTRQVPFTLGEGDNQTRMFIDVTVWNGTVANLTLMALGSSAPEILLSVIEIIGNGFEAGELGPGTIVGSAAFNLLFITAVCVIAVPEGETRRIDVYKVFMVTSFFSFFAYVWMLVVLGYISPCQVEIWEGAVTLACFPLLVAISWWADHRFCFKGRKPRKSFQEKVETFRKIQTGEGIDPETNMQDEEDHPLYVNGQLDNNALIEYYKQIRQTADVTDEEAASLVARKLVQSREHTRLWYRIGACRGLMGGAKLRPVLNQKLQQVYDVLNQQMMLTTGKSGTLQLVHTTPDVYRKKAVFEFQAASFAVPEGIGILSVAIQRTGRADNEVTLRVNTIDGSARAGNDYVPIDKEVIFEPFVYERNISVKIIDDNQWEPDESFFIRISLLEKREDAMVGQTNTIEITIIDDDVPGKVCFTSKLTLVEESSREAHVEVQRIAGSDGEINVKWKTIPNQNGPTVKHPHSVEGTLTFAHGEKKKFITIPLIGDFRGKGGGETFEVELLPPDGGATLGNIVKTGVTISNDSKFQSAITKVVEMASYEVETVAGQNLTYSEQIRAAFTVSGGNVEEATHLDYIFHFLTFFWKILFSLIPPPSYLGGWLCFVFSLTAIGFLTAIIGDLASMFGCLIGVSDTITAITFVALGTSLPDTFASMSAAKQEKNADNAIGNVTGSNSVNVFLGLGVPWTLAAIYHQIEKKDIFAVDPGEMAFSVIVYTAVSIIAMVILVIRRYMTVWGAAELGGPKSTRMITTVLLIVLWFIYVALSALQSEGFIPFFHKIDCPKKVVDYLDKLRQEKANRRHG